MTALVRSLKFPVDETNGGDDPLLREWLVPKGAGGDAPGAIGGGSPPRHHGPVIAAMPPPLGRTMMLNRLADRVCTSNEKSRPLGLEDRAGTVASPADAQALVEFRLENGLPVWHYEVDGIGIERRLVLTHLQNTTYITYRL